MSSRAQVRRVLLTRLRFLGDVVLSTPLLSHLRERLPDASIEYLVDARFADVLQGHPSVDRLHRLSPGAGLGETLELLRTLRRPRIDWWIDLFTNPRSCVLAALASPRAGVGSARGLRSRVYGHRRPRPAGEPNAIEHHLDKLMPLLGPCESRRTQLQVGNADREALHALIGPWEGSPLLLNPGSTWPDKAWPADRWSPLVERLRESNSNPIWMLSPPGEERHAASLAAAAGVRCLPLLPLRPLLALLERSRLYIGNDGGVMHCAVALGTPTLTLFGPTDPQIWFPYEDWGPYRVLRGEQGVLERLTLDEVADAAHQLLAEMHAR